MQVQYYHPIGGPHLLYHYAAAAAATAAAVAAPPPPSASTATMPPPPPGPHSLPAPHQYIAFPFILPQPHHHNPHHHPAQLHQQQRPHHHHQQHPQPAPAALAAAAAFFAAQQQQQQQQYAGLALHFQALSVGGVGGGVVQSGSNSPYEAPGQDRVRSAPFGQVDYNWKLLNWLKTHRMHKYFDRLRKYSYEQLLVLDRDTLESEQFTQGAIKKLLGMLERVRCDRAAFDTPTRSPPSSVASVSSGSSPEACPPAAGYNRNFHRGVVSQQGSVATIAMLPASSSQLHHRHHQLRNNQQHQQQQQRFLCGQN